MRVCLIGEGDLSVVKPAWPQVASIWFAETFSEDQSGRGWNRQRQFSIQLQTASGQPVQHGRGLEPLDGFGGRAQPPPPIGQMGIADCRQIDRDLGILPFFEQLLNAVVGGHGQPGTGDQWADVGVGGAAGHPRLSWIPSGPAGVPPSASMRESLVDSAGAHPPKALEEVNTR